MNKITFSRNDCKEETTSIWLVSVLQYGLKLEFFKPLETFKLKMKKVKFSVYQKLVTIIMSIAVGCEFMKDINEKLGSEKLSANLFNMDSFPDQSQLNKVLNRFDSDSISQFENIHHKLFIQNSSSAFTEKEVVIDFDQTGLIANGKSYESASKGYFSKKKNQSGYQMSAAFAGEHSETVAMYLDSGNMHCQDHFKDLLKSTLSKYNDALKNGSLIIRSDSGYGSADIIELMKSIPNLKFVTKGYSTVKAKNLAKEIPYYEYTQADESAWVHEFPNIDGLRIIIVQILTKSGKLKYSMLVTNIAVKDMDAVELFHFYNKRQTIEAFFKMIKNVYSIKNLRTTSFYGIYGFLWLVFFTHNLIVWFKATTLHNTELKDAGVRVLVKKIGNIKCFVKRTVDKIEVNIPSLTRLSKIIAYALCRSQYEQIRFNI
ncbi:transposase [Clostridium sp.]|uniref:transposase n=2 Tax=Clostridium sp. TaxID=1506 RepID=UPI002FDD7B3D